MITQKKLKELFDYNSDAGIFTRKITVGSRACSGHKAGAPTSNGYLRITIENKEYAVHRLAWIYVYGAIPDNLYIDHINRNRVDNRIANLRLATNAQNQRNREASKHSKTGVNGVCYHRKRKKWVATIYPEPKKRIRLGFYTTIEEAATARKEGELKYWS